MIKFSLSPTSQNVFHYLDRYNYTRRGTALINQQKKTFSQDTILISQNKTRVG